MPEPTPIHAGYSHTQHQVHSRTNDAKDPFSDNLIHDWLHRPLPGDTTILSLSLRVDACFCLWRTAELPQVCCPPLCSHPATSKAYCWTNCNQRPQDMPRPEGIFLDIDSKVLEDVHVRQLQARTRRESRGTRHGARDGHRSAKAILSHDWLTETSQPGSWVA